MKKEIIIAVSVGLFVGLVFVGGYLLNYAITNRTEANIELFNPLIDDFTSPVNSLIKFANGQNYQLNITNPPDQTVTSSNTIAITGQTTPQAILTLIGETSEYVIQADNEGNFNQTVSLISGENEIKLTSFSPSGTQVEKTLSIVVSSFEF